MTPLELTEQPPAVLSGRSAKALLGVSDKHFSSLMRSGVLPDLSLASVAALLARPLVASRTGFEARSLRHRRSTEHGVLGYSTDATDGELAEQFAVSPSGGTAPVLAVCGGFVVAVLDVLSVRPHPERPDKHLRELAVVARAVTVAPGLDVTVRLPGSPNSWLVPAVGCRYEYATAQSADQ